MKKTFISIIFIIPLVCSGGILIEPYAGLDYGLSADTSLTYQNNAYTYDSDSNAGLGYGGRIGYSFAGLFAAFDYSMSTFEIEDKAITSAGVAFSTGTTEKTEVDQTAMAVAVGYRFPMLLRIWGKYIIKAAWEMDEDRWLQSLPLGTVSFVSELKGSGFAAGIGYNIFSFIDIFAEYQTIEVDEVESITFGGAEQKQDYSNYVRKRSSIFFGVSFPFDI